MKTKSASRRGETPVGCTTTRTDTATQTTPAAHG